jgi:hypothetical protein
MNRRSPFGLNSVPILALLSMSLSGCSIVDKAQILSPATEAPISAIVSPTLFNGPALVSYEYKAKYFPQRLILRFDHAESARAAGKLVSVSAVGCSGPAIEVPQQSYQQMQGRFYLATVVTDVTRSGKCDTRSLSINLKQILRREKGENVILQYVLSYENGAFSLSLDESQNMTLSFEAQD